MDDDGDRKLQQREFINGLNDYGLMMPKEERDTLFAALDRDHSGTIDFDEFLERIRVSTIHCVLQNLSVKLARVLSRGQ